MISISFVTFSACGPVIFGAISRTQSSKGTPEADVVEKLDQHPASLVDFSSLVALRSGLVAAAAERVTTATYATLDFCGVAGASVQTYKIKPVTLIFLHL